MRAGRLLAYDATAFGIAMLIEDSPSLPDYPAQILERSYPAARRHAACHMWPSESKTPERYPFNIDAVLDPRWLPGREAK